MVTASPNLPPVDEAATAVPTGVRRKRFTPAQFVQLAEQGLLASRAELFEGEIYEMPPIKLPHAVCTTKLYDALRPHWPEPKQIVTQASLLLPGNWIPEPDLFLIEDMQSEHDIITGIPPLVVGISYTTLPDDLNRKAVGYARCGIAECWIVDLRRELVHVLRQPRGEAA
ncbi:MAG: Uma2 family endonuclease, partial [Planctomycetota bacterium]